MQIINSSAYLLSGVFAYAALTHAQVGLRHLADRKHLLFAALSMAVALYAPINASMMTAKTVEDFVDGSRWAYPLIGLFSTLQVWFIAYYTRHRATVLLAVMVVAVVITMVLSVIQPWGLQFSEVHGLSQRELPWGEGYTALSGVISPWFTFAVSVMFLSTFYNLVALMHAVRLDGNTTLKLMLLATSVHCILNVEGLLVRVGVLNFIPLGLYGILAMVVVMSVALNREYDERRKSYERELERRVQARTGELESARAEAETASAFKTRFMANISHEMRTPMQIILGFAEMGKYKSQRQPAPSMVDYFEKIQDSGQRLNDLIESLLKLAQDAWDKETEIAESDLSPVPPDALLERARISMLPAVRAKQQEIVLDNQSQLKSVRIDEARVSQVLAHLIGNAIRYSPINTTITLRAYDQIDESLQQSALCIQVIDQGCGVPEKEMSAIFEPFYESSRTSTGAGGTGMGLALCRSILERHKGKLSVANRPGGGSIFEMRLPVR